MIEARAEGVAAIDPSGALAERRFPAGGTLGHAALLLIGELHERAAGACYWNDIVGIVGELAEARRDRWAGDLVESPERLASGDGAARGAAAGRVDAADRIGGG